MQLAREHTDPDRRPLEAVLLTIVPTERDDDPTQEMYVSETEFVSDMLCASQPVVEDEVALEPETVAPAPAPAPAPPPEPVALVGNAPRANVRAPAPVKPRRTGLLVAASMGGGMMLGGGVVGAIAVVVLLCMLLIGGVGGMVWLLASVPDPATVVAPPAAEAPATESVTPVAVAPVGGPAAKSPSAVTPAVASTAPSSTTTPPTPTPATTTPATGAPAAKAPASTAPSSGTAGAPAATPAAPAAAPAAPVGNVMVKVITDPPAAHIVVDGHDRGRTPAKLELPAGSHQLLLEAGKASETFTIDAGPGKDRFCFGLNGKKLAQVPCN